MTIDTNTLHKLWNTEQEILDVIHSFCIENNIKYSLGYGTLLGAVRHKGFIPWDDDIDIIMPREDYDRFISLWEHSCIPGYILQSEYSPPLDYTINFTKIRKLNTAFIQSEEEKELRYFKGIFVDVFPCDNIAPSKLSRMIQLFWFSLYMLYSREYTDGSGGFIRFVELFFLSLPFPFHTVLKRIAFKQMTKWNGSCSNYVVPCTFSYLNKRFPANLFDSFVDIEFNNKKYKVTKEWDAFLSSMYGDYMTLPPIEERVWTHSPIYIDFEHSLNE